MNLQLHPAQSDQAELMAQLVRQCWQGRVHPNSSGHHESAQRVLADLERGWGLILWADDQPVGSVRWVPHPVEAGVVEVKKLAVLAAWRGQGLGQRLMRAVEQQACLQGQGEIRLAVRHDQPRLLDWYAQLGYQLQPALVYSAANPDSPPPFVMHKILEVSA